MLLFHHLLPLEHCEPGVIASSSARLWAEVKDEESDRWAWSRFVAYQWLSERIGHWPLFLHVMPTERALAEGYASQFQQIKGFHVDDTTGRFVADHFTPAEFRSLVLFSYPSLDDMPVSFSQRQAWMRAWRTLMQGRPLSEALEREALMPERVADDWLAASVRDDLPDVQAHVPRLDLSVATQVTCRSQAARRELIDRGFDAERIKVRRVPVSGALRAEARRLRSQQPRKKHELGVVQTWRGQAIGEAITGSASAG